MVVQANLLNQEIRIINAYGPQEDEIEKSLSFCQHLEGETISARDENCLTLIQLDANAKVGPEIIPSDPNGQSKNGALLMEMISRQQLFLLHASDLCRGKINPTQGYESWGLTVHSKLGNNDRRIRSLLIMN